MQREEEAEELLLEVIECYKSDKQKVEFAREMYVGVMHQAAQYLAGANRFLIIIIMILLAIPSSFYLSIARINTHSKTCICILVCFAVFDMTRIDFQEYGCHGGADAIGAAKPAASVVQCIHQPRQHSG